jgi:alkanesulfonate monooxygenase SsuD/methylene tetrahydromethanopterin reductase-like flavin-dependent oxidoreductase (luciferase family)
VITSVKDPAETMEKVVDPLMTAASDHDRPRPTVLATRWSIVADDDEEAWRAIYPWRGLRAPGRLEAVDPADLREMADGLPREEILERYSRVSTGAEIIETYLPLVDDLGADIVAFQMAALDQPGLIEMLGKEVLPELRR